MERQTHLQLYADKIDYFFPAVARKKFLPPPQNQGIQLIENGGPTRTFENSATVFSRLGCADDAIANFPPTLDGGPRRSLRRGPARGGRDRARWRSNGCVPGAAGAGGGRVRGASAALGNAVDGRAGGARVLQPLAEDVSYLYTQNIFILVLLSSSSRVVEIFVVLL